LPAHRAVSRIATADVLGGGGKHFEQAVFADEPSGRSLHELRGPAQARWRKLAMEIERDDWRRRGRVEQGSRRDRPLPRVGLTRRCSAP